jgi:hypothetical protein
MQVSSDKISLARGTAVVISSNFCVKNFLMKKIDTAIPDVFLLEPRVFGDDRGFFMKV